MSKNKSCGNCKYLEYQDLDGCGWCDRTKTETHCALSCDFYESLSGWTEITPDNSDDLYKKDEDRIIIAYCHNGEVSFERYVDSQYIPSEMGELGSFYYYVLPELRIHNE